MRGRVALRCNVRMIGCGGMTLAEIGKAVGGMDDAAVSIALKRFEQRAAVDPRIRRWRGQVESVLCVAT